MIGQHGPLIDKSVINKAADLIDWDLRPIILNVLIYEGRKRIYKN